MQLIKRLEQEKPSGENFLDDAAENIVQTLEGTYDVVEEEYKEIKENALTSMVNMLW